MKKGDAVRVADSAGVVDYRGMVGTVRGFRPDGAIVVEFSNGLRRPFKREDLATP